jgi:hypothetical protein
MSEDHSLPWQERILALWKWTDEETVVNDSNFVPSQEWANEAWDQLRQRLEKEYGIETNDKSREYMLGCMVGMAGRLSEDTSKILEMTKEKAHHVAVLNDGIQEIQNVLKSLNDFYIESQKIAAEALPSESASFTEGLAVAKKTMLFNSRALPAFGGDRAPLDFLLGSIGVSMESLGGSNEPIDPEKFQELVDLAVGTNSGDLERVKKFLSDRKAPRRPRGRPKKKK